MFQQYNLLPALTAAENAAIPLVIAGWRKAPAVRRAGEVLDSIGMGKKVESLPRAALGRAEQRVAIARALVHDPKLLVCDEPTAALDHETGLTVMELLREAAVRPDRAVVVVTHDNRVFHFGDRIAHMDDGVSCSRGPQCRGRGMNRLSGWPGSDKIPGRLDFYIGYLYVHQIALPLVALLGIVVGVRRRLLDREEEVAGVGAGPGSARQAGEDRQAIAGPG